MRKLAHLLPLAVGIVLITSLVVEVALVVSTPAVLLLPIVIGWFAAPGVVLVARTLADTPGARHAALALGPTLGLAGSTCGLLAAWALHLPPWLALGVAPALPWLLGWRSPGSLGRLFRAPQFGRADWIVLGALLMLVPLVTMVPFAHVAEPMADGGRAYRAYFTADFVWAMSVSAELAKGDVPPANPFLQGAGLNYYWLSHLLSGAAYRTLAPLGVRLEEVVLTNALAYGLAFIACVYWLARAVGVSAAGASIGCAAGFVANSFEGLERIVSYRSSGVTLDLLRNVNIDAVSRWYYQGMPVDGLQRLLLYQPHHLIGYTLALLALWIVARATEVRHAIVALTAGLLLGVGFLFSTFTAIIVGVAIAALYGARLLREASLRAVVECALVGAAPLALAVALAVVLGYVDLGYGALLHFVVNPVAFHRWPLVLLLNFGPLLLGGVAGLAAWRWSRAEPEPAVALVAVAGMFYFFADVPDMGGVWVGWRAGHLLLVAFGILTGVAIDTIWRAGRFARGVAVPLLVIGGLLAAPTTIIDVYNAQDIGNRERTAMFPWTLVLSKAEQEGLQWIRRATAPDAVVQVDPRVRHAGTWAYIPAFAERRMYAGLPIAMIPLQPYELASDNVTFGIFHAPKARDAWEMARFLGIGYLVIGEPERERYEEAVEMLESDPTLFHPVFQNDALTVYEVASR